MKECATENLTHSPLVTTGFRNRRYGKIKELLNIPDTISEQSGEVSLKSGNMNASSDQSVDSVGNLTGIMQLNSDESSTASTITPINNSYLVECERKFLECSTGSADENVKNLECNYFNKVSRKLGFGNDTISTPPSELKKQIIKLKEEMAESHEFHDLETKVLKEKLDDTLPENYLELIEKYSSLMELYTSLKKEYEQYRIEQEKLKDEIHCTTTDYLENLCSEIEASDNSLSYSNTSFTANCNEFKNSTLLQNISEGGKTIFNTLSNTTILEDISEREVTIFNNGSMLTNDPLALPATDPFKTPKQTPLRSIRKGIPKPLSSVKIKSAGKEWKNLKSPAPYHNSIFGLEDKNKIFDLQNELDDKVKEISDLEQRLLKVEELSANLQNECDRITTVFNKQKQELEHNLTLKSEQLDDLVQKLYTETIALNPGLSDSLKSSPGPKVLAVFIETIMESCKVIQDELLRKHDFEKAEWEKQNDMNITLIKNLNEQVNMFDSVTNDYTQLKKTYELLKEKMDKAEDTIREQNEKICLFELEANQKTSIDAEIRTAHERIAKLESELMEAKNETKEIVVEYQKLDGLIAALETEVKAKEIILEQFENSYVSFVEDDERLKTHVLEELISNLREDLETAKNQKDRNNEFKKTFDILRGKKLTCDDNNSELNKSASVSDCCPSIQPEKLKDELQRHDYGFLKLLHIENQLKSLDKQLLKYESTVNELYNLKNTSDTIPEKTDEAHDRISENSETKSSLELKETANFTEQGELNSELGTIAKLKEQILKLENKRKEISKRFEKLEGAPAQLELAIKSKNNLFEDLEKSINSFLVMKYENENLNKLLKESEEMVMNQKIELEKTREKLMGNEKLQERIERLEEGKQKFKNMVNHILDNKEVILEFYSKFTIDDQVHGNNLLSEKFDEFYSDEDCGTHLTNISQVLEFCCRSLQNELAIKVEAVANDLKTKQETDRLVIESLTDEVKKLNEETKELEQVKMRLEDLTNAHENLKEKLDQAQETISVQNRETELRHSEISSNQETLFLAQEKIKILQSQLADVQNTNSELTGNNQTLQEKLNALEINIGEKENALKNLEIEMSHSQKLKEDYEELKKSIKETADNINGYKEQLNEANSNKEELMSAFASEKCEWEKQQQTNLLRIEYLERELSVLTEQTKLYEATNSELNELKNAHQTLQEQMNRAENVIAKREEEIKHQQSEQTKIQEDLNLARQTINTFECQLAGAEKEKKDWAEKYGKLQDLIESLEADIREKEETLKGFEMAKGETEEIKRKNEELNNAIKESDLLVCNLKKDLEVARTELNKNDGLSSEMNSLKMENEDFKGLLNSLRENKSTLTDMYSKVSFKTNEFNNFTMEKFSETINAPISSLFIRNESQIIYSAINEAVLACYDSVKNEFTSELEYRKIEEENMRVENGELKSKIESLQTEVSSLDELTKSNAITVGELNDLKNAYQVLKEQMSEAENAIAKRDEEIRRQQSQQTRTQEDLHLARQAITTFEHQLAGAEKENIDWAEKYDKLRNMVESLEEDIRVKEGALKDLEASKAAFEEIQRNNEEVNSGVKELNFLVLNLKNDLEVARTELNKNDELLKEIHILKTENNGFKCLLDGLRENRNALTEIYSKVSLKTNDYNNFTAEEISDKINPSLNNSFSRSASDVVFSIIKDSVLACYSSIKHEFTNELEHQKIKEEVADNLKNVVENMKIENINLNTRIEHLESETLALGERAKLYENTTSELNKLKNAHQTLQEQMNRAENVIAKREEEIKQQQSEQTKIQEDLNLARQTINTFECQLAGAEKEKKDWAEKYGKLQDLIESLEADIREKEETLKGFQVAKGETEEIKRKNEELNNAIKESDLLVCNLKKDLEVARTELNKNDGLSNEMNSLKMENEDFKGLLNSLRENKSTLADIYSKVSLNTKDCFAVGEISNKFKPSMNSSFGRSANDVLFCVINETVLACCDSMRHEFTKELEQNRKREEETMEKLNNLLEDVKIENGNLKTRIDDLLLEIESYKKKDICYLEMKDKVKSLEENNEKLLDILSDVQSRLDMPGDTVTDLLSGKLENGKIFSEAINSLVKTQLESLQGENENLRISNGNLKARIKELSQMIDEIRDDALNSSRSKGPKNRNIDLCKRRLDKLEEINQNLTELITRILTLTGFPKLDRLKLVSVRDYPNVSKKVVSHIEEAVAKTKELEAANEKLDEECDSYAKTIKDLNKEAAAVWKANKEKTETFEAEIKTLKDEKNNLENEREKLLTKIGKLDREIEKLRNAKMDDAVNSCNCGSERKKIGDLKRTILVKEQKILELQDLQTENALHKSQIKYLENALEQEKKKAKQEREKSKKLQSEIAELSKNQKAEKNASEDNEMLDELRMHGTVSRGIVQDFVDKEKMRKLAKDIGILKELCRARYAEIKRLEAENASLRNVTPKNTNQMDSPIRIRSYNTRSKNMIRDIWKPEVDGKEN